MKGFKNDLMKIEYKSITITTTTVYARKKNPDKYTQTIFQYHNDFILEIWKENRTTAATNEPSKKSIYIYNIYWELNKRF